MKHLEDSDLVLYHYRDGDDLEAAGRHLESCAECRNRLEMFSATLQLVSPPELPARAENYGSQVWDRVRAYLPEQEPRLSLLWWRRWAVGVAFAGLLVAAFLLGRQSRPQQQPTVASTSSAPTTAGVTPQQMQERVLLVALGDHLDRSQMLLVELSHAGGGTGETDISSQQQLAAQLAKSNRLYRDTAQQVGDTSVSNALDQLERVLLEIVHEPSNVQADHLQELQQKIQKQGILFKVRVIRNNVQHELTSPEPASKPKEQNI